MECLELLHVFILIYKWNRGGPIENDEAIKEEENDLIGNGIGDEE